jgi:hypothetical protein
MSKQKNNTVSLADAPQSIKLAVDLIQVLEENQIETDVALQALDIVIEDFKRKQKLNN